MATVRGGFHIYQCWLQELALKAHLSGQDSHPGKGPDHEISEVKWMSRGWGDVSEIRPWQSQVMSNAS